MGFWGSEFYVYGLVDSRNDELFYVGISGNPKIRYRTHLNESGRLLSFIRGKRSNISRDLMSAKHYRVLDIMISGAHLSYCILERVVDNPLEKAFPQATEREKYWISYLRDMGYSLLNTEKQWRFQHPMAKAKQRISLYFTDEQYAAIERASGKQSAVAYIKELIAKDIDEDFPKNAEGRGGWRGDDSVKENLKKSSKRD